MSLKAIVVAVVAALAPGLTSGSAEVPRASATFTKSAPVLDGKLDDPVWKQAPVISFQRTGFIDSAERDKTAFCQVRFLWSKAGLYAAVEAFDRSPAYGQFRPGQPRYLGDVFEFFIDQRGDHRQFYEVQIDPDGGTYFRNNLLTAPPRLTKEKRLAQEFVESELWRYDLPQPEGFRVASRRDSGSGRWTMEFFLPASLVNRRRGGKEMTPCTWRINLVRLDWDKPLIDSKRRCSYFYWAPVLEGHPHISPGAMGYLDLKKP